MSFPCKDSRERENSAKDMPGEKEAGSSAGREPLLNLPSAGTASSKKTTVFKDERGGRERRGREGEWGGS